MGRVSIGCGKAVWRVRTHSLDGVGRLSTVCGGHCHFGVQRLSRGFRENVYTV